MNDHAGQTTVFFACPKCSLPYRTTQVRRPVRVSGSTDCLRCGGPVHRWTGFYDFIGWRPSDPIRATARRRANAAHGIELVASLRMGPADACRLEASVRHSIHSTLHECGRLRYHAQVRVSLSDVPCGRVSTSTIIGRVWPFHVARTSGETGRTRDFLITRPGIRGNASVALDTHA
jgi:hypothetical protein